MGKPDFKFKLPIFGTDVIVLFFKNKRDDFIQYCQKTYGTIENPEVILEDCPGMTCGAAIYLEDPMDMTIKAHEIDHLVSNITDAKGIKDVETRAYICGYISDKIDKHLRKKGYYG